MSPFQICSFVPFMSLSPPSPKIQAWQRAAATTALSAALILSDLHISHISFNPQCLLQPTHVQAAAHTTDEEHALAEEAWGIIDKYYYNDKFNGVDWNAERLRLNSSKLKTRDSTYNSIRQSLRRLNDRYTRLLTPSDMLALRKYDVSGVGLLLSENDDGELFVMSDPSPDTAAGKAGIRRGDVVTEIDGKSVKNIGAFDVAGWMQGEDGSVIRVTFRNAGETKLIRNFEKNENMESLMSVSDIGVLENEQNMGYIRLKDFSAASRQQVGRAIAQLKNEGAEWLVLDLRGNGGGVFEGALEIGGLFQGDGKTMVRVHGRPSPSPSPSSAAAATAAAAATKEQKQSDELFKSRLVETEKENEQWKNVDLAIILDDRSASSSEVLAAGLHDNCAAALVGNSRSFGKGLIQGVFGMSDGSGLVVTVAEYRTPRDEQIDGVGLQPDIGLSFKGVGRMLNAVGVQLIDKSGFVLSRDRVSDTLRMCREQQKADY